MPGIIRGAERLAVAEPRSIRYPCIFFRLPRSLATRPQPPFRLIRLVLWLLVAIVVYIVFQPDIDRWLVTRQAEPRAIQARGDLAADEQATIEVFEGVSPSVVYITTVERVVNLWTRNVTQVPRGTGSGFMWDEHGHVVTNFHVLEDAEAAYVRLADERAYEAVLVGASREHDLAVLRIHVAFDRPPPVPVGESHNLRVGQKVFAIGNPFGLDRTLTTGVISALDRSIQGEGGNLIEHLIQTDAAINPGNSGGPLIDSAGRLIGINTAIYSPSGAYAGVGFAVPVDTVNRVVPKLIAFGRHVTPSLGIVADSDISERVTARMGVQGLLILRVEEGSPADKAGLRGTFVNREGDVVPGDVVQALGDIQVRDIDDLTDGIEGYDIGDRLEITVHREGSTQRLPLVLHPWR